MSAWDSRPEERMVDRGKKIYRRLRSSLEPAYKGKVIAIEVESEEYVIGEDELDAALRALERFPDKRFYFVRVGYPAVHKLR